MEIYRSLAELRAHLDAERAKGRTIGMVGTSGAMHKGHQSLIRRSGAENDINLLYWGGVKANFDWKAASTSAPGYERDPNRDFPIAEEAGAQILFAPPGDVMYPRRPMTKVSLPEMSSNLPIQLEDPAHLDTIAIAMCKIWNMVQPHRIYFGEKDWQHLAMFQRLADDLHYRVEVLGCPTIREEDGLATSSRNAQLTPEDREKAPVIYQALCAVRDAAESGGVQNAVDLRKTFADIIGEAGEIRYFMPVVSDTMQPLDALHGSVRVLTSVQMGSVRLLDNIGIELPA